MRSTLTDISGVGPHTAKLLMEHGLTSPSDIAGAAIERLCAIPGFSRTRAGALINSANERLAVATENTATTIKAATRPRLIAQKPMPESTISNTSTNPTKPEEEKKLSKKKQEKLIKAKKAAAKKAKAKKGKSKKGKSKKGKK